MNSKPRLLDLFCGAGGAAMGYSRVGFEVVGVDIKPQPRYPFEFVQADVLQVLAEWDECRPNACAHIDAIHASPPCQAHTRAWKLQKNEHPDLIAATRRLLQKTGLPWVIENVPGAPLFDPVVLEGQMFEGLRTIRQRHFETNWPLEVPLLRPPRPRQVKMGRKPGSDEWIQVVGHFSDVAEAEKAMGIYWMTRDELAQAIPPDYTEFIGTQLIAHLKATVAA